MSPKLQSSVSPTIGLTQAPASGPDTTQGPETPVVGSGSLRVTSLATPSPVFWTSIVNTALSPALIVPCTAVLITPRPGFLQVTWPSSSTGSPALVAEAVAVLS